MTTPRKHITEQSDFDQFGPPSDCCGVPVIYHTSIQMGYVVNRMECSKCGEDCNIGRVILGEEAKQIRETMEKAEKPKNRIVIAAIKKNGIVFTGLRHGFIIRDMVNSGFIKDPNKDHVYAEEQGFVDANNIFLTREGARGIAIQAGQIKPDHGTLYSEDLW